MICRQWPQEGQTSPTSLISFSAGGCGGGESKEILLLAGAPTTTIAEILMGPSSATPVSIPFCSA